MVERLRPAAQRICPAHLPGGRARRPDGPARL